MGNGGLDRGWVGRLGGALGRHVEAKMIPGAVGLVARGGDVHVESVGETAFDGGAPADAGDFYAHRGFPLPRQLLRSPL